jgi:S1-C subfamily serine protease
MPSIQGFQPKVSKGIISSTSGLKDDSRHYQTAVQVQPGNSGGMLADMDGHIIGVIVSTLRSSEIYRQTGVMPQNVNYAIKSYLVLELIDRSGLKNIVTFAPQADKHPDFEVVVKRCTNSVVMIIVY